MEYTFDSLDQIIDEIAEEAAFQHDYIDDYGTPTKSLKEKVSELEKQVEMAAVSEIRGTTTGNAWRMWKTRYFRELGGTYSQVRKRYMKMYRKTADPDEQLRLLFEVKNILLKARLDVATVEESWFRQVVGFGGQILAILGAFFLLTQIFAIPGAIVAGVGTSIYTGLRGLAFQAGRMTQRSIGIKSQHFLGNVTKQMILARIDTWLADINNKARYIAAGKLLSMNNGVANTVEKYGEGMVKYVVQMSDDVAGKMVTSEDAFKMVSKFMMPKRSGGSSGGSGGGKKGGSGGSGGGGRSGSGGGGGRR